MVMSRVIGHGIDIVSCNRIAQLASHYGDRFLKRVFTTRELEYSLSKKRCWEHLAGRFAVKEAVMKVLGTGWQAKLSWSDIEVVNNSSGKPELYLSGYAKEIADKLGIRQIQISISHTEDYAIGSAIGLAD